MARPGQQLHCDFIYISAIIIYGRPPPPPYTLYAAAASLNLLLFCVFFIKQMNYQAAGN